MKNAYACAPAIALFSVVFACGHKPDMSADNAADAWQALAESKDHYDARAEDVAWSKCAESGTIDGLTKTRERDRDARGLFFTVRLNACQNRGIMLDGAVTREGDATGSDGEGVTRYTGDLTLQGAVNGRCELHLVDAPMGSMHEPSTFCGYNVLTLMDILAARQNTTEIADAPLHPTAVPVDARPAAPPPEPETEADFEEDPDRDVTDTADVEDLPDDAFADENNAESDVDVAAIPEPQLPTP